MSFRVSVPGNLLLAGEYAVLEEGGRGLAVAIEPRLTVTAEPAAAWAVEGHWNGGSETWAPGTEPTFAGRVFLHVLGVLGTVSPARLVIDSTPFFEESGRKRGFGSSAALAAALTAALAKLAGLEQSPELDLPQVAVDAHRHAQGGRGSGYDVAASWFGGYGEFFGGARPRWRRLSPESLPRLGVFAGPQAVRTTGSIALYRSWKSANPGAAAQFLEDSNAAVGRWAQSAGDAWFEAAAAAKTVGLEVGRAVGSPADLEPPAFGPEVFIKAVGAGNETGLAAFRPGAGVSEDNVPDGLDLLTLAEGLRWE